MTRKTSDAPDGSGFRYRMDGETLAQRRNFDLLYVLDSPGKPPMRRDVHWTGDGAGYLVSGAPHRLDCFPARVAAMHRSTADTRHDGERDD